MAEMPQVQTSNRPCRAALQVFFHQTEGWKTAEVCPNNVPADTRLVELDLYCQGCPLAIRADAPGPGPGAPLPQGAPASPQQTVINMPTVAAAQVAPAISQALLPMPSAPVAAPSFASPAPASASAPVPAPEATSAAAPSGPALAPGEPSVSHVQLEQVQPQPDYKGIAGLHSAPGACLNVQASAVQQQPDGSTVLFFWGQLATAPNQWGPAQYFAAQDVYVDRIPAQPIQPVQPAPVLAPTAFTPAPAPMTSPETAHFLPIPAAAFAEEESKVDIDAVLKTIPGYQGGPSGGGFSSHALEPVREHCDRKCFLARCLGLVKVPEKRHFAYGKLFHAVWEMHYRSGGARSFDPITAVRLAGDDGLASEVAKLVMCQHQKFAQEEAATWAIRAVEEQDIAWAPPRKIGGKTVYLPFACRHDLLVALVPSGQAHPAPNQPCSQGVMPVDWKALGQTSYEDIKAYDMSPQFQHNCAVYERGLLRRVHGPLAGVIISIAVKHKNPTPDRSLFRIYANYMPAQIERYWHEQMIPAGERLYTMLADTERRKDMNLWPQNNDVCFARFGCDYVEICRGGNLDVLVGTKYKQDPSRIINLDELQPPPEEVKKFYLDLDPERRAAAEKRSAEHAVKKEGSVLLASVFKSVSASQGWRFTNTQNYLTSGHNESSVKKQLQTELASAWTEKTKLKLPNSTSGKPDFECIVNPRGLSWELRTPTGKTVEKGRYKGQPAFDTEKGQLTWKELAESLCHDWWSPEQLEKMRQAQQVEQQALLQQQPAPVAAAPVATVMLAAPASIQAALATTVPTAAPTTAAASPMDAPQMPAMAPQPPSQQQSLDLGPMPPGTPPPEVLK